MAFSFQRGRSILSSAAGAFSFQRGRCILSSAAGVIFFSAAEGHSCHLQPEHFLFSGGRCILSSAAGVIFFSAGRGILSCHLQPEHFLVSGTGVSAEQTAAAVGRQNACPPGAVLQPFRGRRQFEDAVCHTFPAKSRPVEAILYVHRPRSRKYPAFASGTALPSLHEMPRLRLRECLAFTLRNFRSAKANLLCQWRMGILVFCSRSIFLSAWPGHSFICSEVIFLSAWPVHPFICGTGASAEQTAAAVGRQNACPSGAVLQPFRGRRQFEDAVCHTFPAKSRPLEAILYIHRPRSRAAPPPELPCLRKYPAPAKAIVRSAP